MHDAEELLRATYAAFNAREIDAALSAMAPDVDWPNAVDGGRVVGHDALRAYWARQFETLDPRVDPEDFEIAEDGDVVVEVHQVVRGLDGAVLADNRVKHVYTLRDGLIARMQIVGPEEPA